MAQEATTARSHGGFAFVQAVNVILGIVELFLALRILLELLLANPQTAFVAWVYAVSGALMGPLVRALPNVALGHGSLLDLSALLALVLYAVMGRALVDACYALFERSSLEQPVA